MATSNATGTEITSATVEDLYRYSGKAELVNRQLRVKDGTGDMPGSAAGAIYASLREHVRRTGTGRAYADGVSFLVDLPNRQSFCPDASYYTGYRSGMKFLPHAPVFAVEVRSENDYGSTAEREMRDKRADYFAAGTLVIWDVDLLSEDVVRAFRDGNADMPAATFRR